MGFGASPYSVSDRKLISRSQLDIACPDRPVFLIKYDGHTCVINTKIQGETHAADGMDHADALSGHIIRRPLHTLNQLYHGDRIGHVESLDVNKAVKRKLPRIGGCFETALDGCFGSMDAAMLEPYEGTDSRSLLVHLASLLMIAPQIGNFLLYPLQQFGVDDAGMSIVFDVVCLWPEQRDSDAGIRAVPGCQ